MWPYHRYFGFDDWVASGTPATAQDVRDEFRWKITNSGKFSVRVLRREYAIGTARESQILIHMCRMG